MLQQENKRTLNSILRNLYFKFQCRKNGARTFFWSLVFSHFGEKSRVIGRIVVYYPQNISIGENSTLNEGCILNARGLITIGDDTHISSCVLINTGGLNYNRVKEERMHFSKPICISNGVWVGSGAIINPGVTIGENSVVGAGAVVTKDVPSDVVVAGIPARVIKNIESQKGNQIIDR